MLPFWGGYLESQKDGYFTKWLNGRRCVTNMHKWPIYILLTPHVLLYIIGNYNNHNDTVPVFNRVD